MPRRRHLQHQLAFAPTAGSMLFALLLVACSQQSAPVPERPANLLPQERFEQLLVDFALAESAANMNIKNVPNYRMDTVYAFDPLKDNGVRPSQYDSTLAYYAHHPDLYKKVYENVLAQLSELQVRRDSLRPTLPAK